MSQAAENLPAEETAAETANTVTENNDVSPLAMSDDKISSMSEEEFVATLTQQLEGGVPAKEPVETAEEDSDEETGAADGEAVTADATDSEEAASDAVDDRYIYEQDPDSEKEEASEDTAEDSEEVKTDETVDYEKQYKELLAPFKANGRTMEVTDIEDARSLMQMGANYNKKMAALKPHRKFLRMLEQNDLLNEEKVNFLIALDKKDPAAIKKLVTDSKINPIDLSSGLTDDADYKPEDHAPTDAEMEVQEVLDEIESTPSYGRTLDIIGTIWDGTSKQALLQSPAHIKVINSQVESGMYDQIMAGVEHERTMGRLTDISDLEAYVHVGAQLEQKGLLKTGGTQNQQAKPERKVPVKKADDPEVRARKKSASSPKAKPTKSEVDFNPLSMSDEEFEKLYNQKFLS